MDKIKVVRLAELCKIETFGWMDRRRRQSGGRKQYKFADMLNRPK